jgi:hypothetical protein
MFHSAAKAPGGSTGGSKVGGRDQIAVRDGDISATDATSVLTGNRVFASTVDPVRGLKVLAGSFAGGKVRQTADLGTGQTGHAHVGFGQPYALFAQVAKVAGRGTTSGRHPPVLDALANCFRFIGGHRVGELEERLADGRCAVAVDVV